MYIAFSHVIIYRKSKEKNPINSNFLINYKLFASLPNLLCYTLCKLVSGTGYNVKD